MSMLSLKNWPYLVFNDELLLVLLTLVTCYRSSPMVHGRCEGLVGVQLGTVWSADVCSGPFQRHGQRTGWTNRRGVPAASPAGNLNTLSSNERMNLIYCLFSKIMFFSLYKVF